MGAAIALKRDEFRGAVEKGGILLIDWWAAWCGPCRAFAPVFEEVAAENPDAVFAKIDTDAEVELAQAFGIQSIPTLMVFRDRVLLYNEPGMLPKQGLTELLGQVRKLDMDEVRKQIAAEEAAGGEGADNEVTADQPRLIVEK